MSTEFTPLPQINTLVTSVRAAYNTGRTRSREWRLEQLNALLRFLKERQSEVYHALEKDLGRSRFVSLTAEIMGTEMEIVHAKKSLARWMKPTKVSTPIIHFPAKSFIVKEPVGVVLVIAPWNYPLQLCLGPMVGALAAGNAVVLKPSEVASATSELLARYLPEYLDSECLRVVEGAVEETTELLKQKFDHIFYTGSGTVGRIVMKAAAEHLTPVTLELGGKSPCLVARDANLEVTAKRIVWGKFFNCGQTCIAPDYVLVEGPLYDQFLECLQETVRKFWSPDIRRHKEYGRLISERHFDRIMGLLDGGGDIILGGEGNRSERFLEPTILTNVPGEAQVMEDEIFGPVLPVLPVESMDAAIEWVNARPKPLALYLFSESEALQEKVLERTSSGGAVLNHCLLHNLVPELPFGGVGQSGIGSYHGKSGFDTFTHQKSVMKKSLRFDHPLLYPNYAKRLGGVAQKLLNFWRNVRSSG